MKERITELHTEIGQAKEDFKQLQKERGVLTKEREFRQEDIEKWTSRCNDLQMLKFGRIIDLDELEASSDRSKVLDAEAQLKADEEVWRMKSLKIEKENEALLENLAQVINDFIP